MNIFREIISVIAFLVAIYFVVDFFNSGFNWLDLIIGILCFFSAYLIWPSKRLGQRDDDHWLLNCLEVLIELPTEIVLWVFRPLAKLISGIGEAFDT